MHRFLSTLSLRRATGCFGRFAVDPSYFYPRSPCGERPCIMTITICTALFLSTLSLRRATGGILNFFIILYNFYPRSPCGERQAKAHSGTDLAAISIHALLAESDVASLLATGRPRYFYPRSPCGERPDGLFLFGGRNNFYPRSPCGERRCYSLRYSTSCWYFYPRSPCGERPSVISILSR